MLTKVVAENSMVRIRRVLSMWLVALMLGWVPTAVGEPAEDLISAAERGDAAVVKVLLAKGADVNAKDDGGRTALMTASDNGHLDVVKALLAKGADVNATASNGWTALMAASYNGHVDVVKTLLAKGTDVNAKDNDGATALDVATAAGHAEVGALLRQADAKAAQSDVVHILMIDVYLGNEQPTIRPIHILHGLSEGDFDIAEQGGGAIVRTAGLKLPFQSWGYRDI